MIICLILKSADCCKLRLESGLSFLCEEDSLHFEDLDEFYNKYDNNDHNDDDGGTSSALMIKLRVPSASEIPELWE